MSLLTDTEKIQAAEDVWDLILASGQEAVLLRSQPGERLYDSDDATYTEAGSSPLEFVEPPPEDLNNKIDAVACVLPDVDIRPEEHLRAPACRAAEAASEVHGRHGRGAGRDGGEFRVQTVEENRLFGVVTHKVLKLVRLHGS